MTQITLLNHDGASQEVKVGAGSTVMQASIDNGIEGIVAECGGVCSCAACHSYIDDAWLEKNWGASGIDQDILDCVVDPQPSSLLGC
jgi:2Fe-2S ferredoxin